MTISIITPTYNRKNLISLSVNSSIELIKSGFASELIIVDDASSDETVKFLEANYRNEIEKNYVKIIKLRKNIGVTGAKNKGAQIAKEDWLIFMDSDDLFLPNSGDKIYSEIKSHEDHDIIFFRCQDIDSKIVIGPPQEKTSIDIETLINYGTPGECLPAVKRRKFLLNPYIEHLRGCESTTYIKIAASGSKILLSDIVARGYRSNGNDRLSNKKNIYLRSDKMYEYNKLLLKYRKYMNLKTTMKTILKLLYYYLISKIYVNV